LLHILHHLHICHRLGEVQVTLTADHRSNIQSSQRVTAHILHGPLVLGTSLGNASHQVADRTVYATQHTATDGLLVSGQQCIPQGDDAVKEGAAGNTDAVPQVVRRLLASILDEPQVVQHGTRQVLEPQLAGVGGLEIQTKGDRIDGSLDGGTGVVDLGDNFEVLGRKYHNSNEELTLLGEQMLDRIGGAAKCPVIHVHGNHDGIGTDFFKPEFWNGIAKSRNHAGAVYADAGSYFYVDIDKSSTRLVALSLPSDSELDTEYPTPVWAFGKKQLDWLKDTALDTEKDVILLIHVPFYYRYEGDEDPKISTWDGKRVRESYVSALCGFIDDLDEAVSALTEFKSRGRGRLVAALSGHTHRDFLFEPFDGDNRNPLPCHQAVTAATCFSTDDEARFCFAIDIAIWTPSAGELSLIRLGDGEDRRIKL